MRSARVPLWVGTTIVLTMAAACSDGVSPTTSIFESASTTSTSTSSTTTTPTSTTTSTTTTTTTTVVPTDTVGDPAALEALITQLNDDFINYEGEIPIPDLTNPDPLVAMEEIWLFSVWSSAAKTSPKWLDIFYVINSPAHNNSVGASQNAEVQNWSIQYSTEGSFLEASPLDIGDPVFSDVNLAGAPQGSVGVLFEAVLPSYTVTDLDDNSIVTSGTPDVSQIAAVLAPTATGWKYYAVKSLP